jgi:selenocysteine lyase/cysteine desulfurase
MGVTRKELLAGAAVAGLAAGCGGSKKQALPADPRDWAWVKAQFALDRGVRHFDAFVLASHPKPVRDAIERHRNGLDRDPNGYLRKHEVELEQRVRDAGARYLGVNATDLALTDSTTMGLGLVYGGVQLARGKEEVVATEHDFYATHESLRWRFGDCRRIRLYDDPATVTPDAVVARVKRGVTDRTGLLALTWVHSSTGVKLPIRAIADALDGHRRNGLLMVVDGVHAFGVEDEPVDIHSFDVLAAGTHKWLGGPRGTGLVWSIKAWDGLRPTIPTFDGASYVAWLEGRAPQLIELPPGATFTPGGFHSFEHRWALAEAFEFMHAIGRERTRERIHGLARRLKEGLAEQRHVTLVTPIPENVSAGVVCFDVAGMPAGQAVERLAREHRIAASVTPYAEEHVRLGCGLTVDERDVDAAIAAVHALA